MLLLAGYLLETNQRRLGVQGLRLDDSAKQALQRYDWPGNVRELEHLLSRAALKAVAEQGRTARTVTLTNTHLNIDTADHTIAAPTITAIQAPLPITEHQTLKEAVDLFQREVIRQVLAKHNDNQAATARELGLNRSNFYRLLQRLELR